MGIEFFDFGVFKTFNDCMKGVDTLLKVADNSHHPYYIIVINKSEDEKVYYVFSNYDTYILSIQDNEGDPKLDFKSYCYFNGAVTKDYEKARGLTKSTKVTEDRVISFNEELLYKLWVYETVLYA